MSVRPGIKTGVKHMWFQNLCGIGTGLVYLTWTTLSFQTGILMDVRGNRRVHKLAV